MPNKKIPWLHDGKEVRILPKDLMKTENAVSLISECVKNSKPLSLIRVGDGELSVMAQNTVLPTEYLKKSAAWGSTDYCGVCLKDDLANNYVMRARCIEAVKSADLVGLFPNEEFTDRVFSFIKYKPDKIFYAFANVQFCFVTEFVNLIISNPPLLVGRRADRFAEYIKEKLGVTAAGVYTDIKSSADIEKTISFMSGTPHEWSLVSAGVNADIIAPLMARRYGKVCLDYGQGMDVMVDPKYNGDYYFYGYR